MVALEAAGHPRLGEDAGEVAGVGRLGLEIQANAGELAFDALVDFSTPDGTAAWLDVCAARSVAMVIGTTGHGPDERRLIEDAAARIPIVLAPNLSVGANVLLKVAEDVAGVLARATPELDVGIVDVHHRGKRDAPSGTALALRDAVRAGHPGGDASIACLRLGTRPGDHAVHFGLPGETLSLSHSADSRVVFASGALRAARWARGRAPGLYGMHDVLFGADA